MVCLSGSYPLKFFKGCLLQVSLCPFLNTLTQMYLLSSKDTGNIVPERKWWETISVLNKTFLILSIELLLKMEIACSWGLASYDSNFR